MLDPRRLAGRLLQLDPRRATAIRKYVNEASFFHRLVSADLDGRTDLEIVEVGAGIGLLALQLAADGHRVTAFEPQSAGYGEMHAMRSIVLECWTGDLPPVVWHDQVFAGNLLDPGRPVDLALSVNVLEHVERPAALVAQVTGVLGPGGRYRFICPNYAVPYEPHFNIPTLFSKRLTGLAFAKAIRTAAKPDPHGLWNELSWPTQHGLRTDLHDAGVVVRFSSRATQAYLERLRDDPDFAARKGPILGRAVRVASHVLHALVGLLPPALLPVIDATAHR